MSVPFALEERGTSGVRVEMSVEAKGERQHDWKRQSIIQSSASVTRLGKSNAQSGRLSCRFVIPLLTFAEGVFGKVANVAPVRVRIAELKSLNTDINVTY